MNCCAAKTHGKARLVRALDVRESFVRLSIVEGGFSEGTADGVERATGRRVKVEDADFLARRLRQAVLVRHRHVLDTRPIHLR